MHSGEKIDWGEKKWFEYHFANYDKDDVTSYFNYAKRGYENYREAKKIEIFKKTIAIKEQLTVLEIGSAMGYFCNRLSRLHRGLTVIGIDFAPHMVIQASKQYSNPLFVSGAFPAFPFKANSFDYIFATEVLYYVSDTERKKTWDQIRKILKPGGRVFFTSLLDDGSRYFTAKSALDMAAETMKIERVFYDYNFLFNLISRPVTKFVRMTEYITGKSSMSHNRERIVRKFVGISKIPIIGEVLTAGLKVMEFFAKSFLCLQQAPETLSKVSKRTLGDKARTHIAVIARKNTRLKSRKAKVS